MTAAIRSMKMMLARSGSMFSASASSRLIVAAKSGRQIIARMASTIAPPSQMMPTSSSGDGKNIAEQEAHEIHSHPGHEGEHDNGPSANGGMGQQAQQRVG
jgi:hypothetical protein